MSHPRLSQRGRIRGAARRTCRAAGAALAAALALLAAPGARANPASNLELVQGALHDAVVALIGQAPALPAGSVVQIRGLTSQEANWLAEHSLTEVLAAHGFHPVILPWEAAKPDSTAPAPAARADSTVLPHAPYALEYRVVELTLTYPRSWHPNLLGARRVERSARAIVYGRVRKTDTDEVVWVGQGSGAREDAVQASSLRSLSTATVPLTSAAAVPPGRGVSRFLEPVLVTAIIVSLVSLFYSNR